MYQIRKRFGTEQWEVYRKYGYREVLLAVVDTKKEAITIKNVYIRSAQ